MELTALLGDDGALSRGMQGYEPRPGQLQMARAVETALARDSVLLVEAGTGTGKTLAYLAPALLSGKRVVISTGTRALQDQIMGDALPLLERCVGSPLSVAYMKGLSNYLCLRRFDLFRHGPESLRGAAARALPVLERWQQRTEIGDLSELSSLSDQSGVLSQVSSGSDTRMGARCKHFDSCYVTRMRKQAADAQVVVVNHHLFFADLALRRGGEAYGAGVIPDYDAVIFDEAHMIEDIATDFFGVSIATGRLETLVRDAERTLGAMKLDGGAGSLVEQVALTGAALFTALPRPAATEGGRVPLDPAEFSGRVQAPMFALDDALEALSGFAERHAERGDSLVQLSRRATQVRNDLSLIADGGGEDRVTWTSQRGRGVTIGASPIDVGASLSQELFMRGHAVVLTSATLTTAGSFEFVRSRLGVEEDAEELSLPSPFDYAAQAALYLPQDIGDPRDPGFLERAATEIVELVALTGGGAFVLCTSLRAMHALSKRCRPSMSRPVYVQGEAPSNLLLQRFREEGDAVLFATQSFWQGVDVPGDALRLVIIDKLPFDVPTDPLVESRCARLQEQGVQPFMKYLVPSAALSLKQGFGRLIRGRGDRGIVAILDDRLSRKGYGKVLLRSLPDARRCTQLDEVREFWESTS